MSFICLFSIKLNFSTCFFLFVCMFFINFYVLVLGYLVWVILLLQVKLNTNKKCFYGRITVFFGGGCSFNYNNSWTQILNCTWNNWNQQHEHIFICFPSKRVKECFLRQLTMFARCACWGVNLSLLVMSRCLWMDRKACFRKLILFLSSSCDWSNTDSISSMYRGAKPVTSSRTFS